MRRRVGSACVAAVSLVSATAFSASPPDRALLLAVRHGHTAALHGTTYALPAITAGKILSATVHAAIPPGVPAISVSFTASVGVSYIALTFTGPSGHQYTYADWFAPAYPAVTNGTVEVQQVDGGANLYAQPGLWTLTGAAIQDYADGTTHYAGAQLAALFPTLTYMLVNAGTPDTTPPVIASGKIVTPTVSLSGGDEFIADVTASDSDSGVYTLELTLNDPSGKPYIEPAFSFPNAPAPSGTFELYSPIFQTGAKPPVGLWTITGYFVCDAAQNCLQDETAADIKALFGSATFKVTK